MQTESVSHIDPEVEPQPTPEEVLAELDRLLASRHLRESKQLHDFLDYVVRQTLLGQQESLKEYLLGCEVFGRRHDYDPRHDGIVRVQATTLRKRLQKYYQEDGVDDPVVIDIPRGGYVPTYHYRAHVVTDVSSSLAATQIAPYVAPTPLPIRYLAAAFFAGALVIAVAGWAWSTWVNPSPATPYQMTSASPSDFPELWNPFFERGSRNVVAYGVPLFFVGEGLYMRDVEVNVPQSDNGPRVEAFARMFGLAPVPTDDTYTGLGEVEGTNLLANFFTSRGIPAEVANARALGRSDLRGRNLIVVSSLRFQTLLRDMKLPVEFEFEAHSARGMALMNLHPLPGEEAAYAFRDGAGVSTSYAIVSVWPGIDPGTRLVHIGGQHTWATQGAVEFLLKPEQSRRLAAAFAKDRQSGAHGKVSPYFQIVLRVEGRGNQAHKTEYVTHHYLVVNKDS